MFHTTTVKKILILSVAAVLISACSTDDGCSMSPPRADQTDSVQVATTIGEVVACNTCNHDVTESEFGDRSRETDGFTGVEGCGLACRDCTEAAASSATIAHHDESGLAMTETLRHVRALRVLADGSEFVAPEDIFHRVDFRREGELLSGPRWAQACVGAGGHTGLAADGEQS